MSNIVFLVADYIRNTSHSSSELGQPYEVTYERGTNGTRTRRRRRRRRRKRCIISRTQHAVPQPSRWHGRRRQRRPTRPSSGDELSATPGCSGRSVDTSTDPRDHRPTGGAANSLVPSAISRSSSPLRRCKHAVVSTCIPTHAGGGRADLMTSTSDLLTSGSMCVPSLVLIAQLVYLLQRGHLSTHTHT